MTEHTPNAVVTSLTRLSDCQIILRVAADGWPLPDFLPGQFAVLGLSGLAPRCSWAEREFRPSPPQALIRRAYSIASSSKEREYLEFYISLVSDGALTPRLFALSLGSRLWLSPKVAGIFTLDQVDRSRNVVLIATGTGLAPYVSMLRTEMIDAEKRRFVVLHGAYHSWDLGYRSEMHLLDHLFANFTYLETIDDPQSEPVRWHGATGRVEDLWQGGWIRRRTGFSPSPANTDIFLCGNQGMIEDMLALLAGEGFQEPAHGKDGAVHVERY
jgi:ferredoxin--NADP+ reductase